MGQTFAKCVKSDKSSDDCSVYELPAVAIDEKDGGKKKKKRFLRWRKGRKGQAERGEPDTTPPATADRSRDEDVIAGHRFTAEFQENEETRSSEAEETPSGTDPGDPWSPDDRSVSHSGDVVVQSSVRSLSDSLFNFNVIQTPVHSGSDTNQNAGQDPVRTESNWDEDDSQTSLPIGWDWDAEIEQTPVSQSEEKLEDENQKNGSIEKINSCQYEIGKKLGEGAFGFVYEATRLSDGLKVAVKYVDKNENTDYISIPGCAEKLPREVALQILASEGDDVPEIIQLLDWQDFEKYYVLVLERFTPCEDLCQFVCDEENEIDEETAKVIMWQATKAAYTCCKRGVFHRDIKLQNFLINKDTLEVKLIDFGCGDFLKRTAYTEFIGTEEYFCPEFFKTGKYYAQPTTVYSLGVMLFTLLCGTFPDSNDKQQMTNKMWSKDGFSKEYCSLIEACLQENPRERIRLRKIHSHKWFQDKHQTDDQQKVTECPADEDVNRLSEGEIQLPLARVSQSEDKMGSIEEINSCQYEIGKKLGKGACGLVYEATRLSDGLKVAVKYVDKDENTDYISIPGCAEKLPREVALQILASEGDDVPEIIQLLDWQDFEKYYVLVLERFTPCEDLCQFVCDEENEIDEETAKVIMWQATKAAYTCCKRGVFHRDIKLENFLINKDTLEVKLIDFGCGDFLKRTAYTEFIGTEEYFCPEFFKTGKYYAKPTTVYSLGVMLFTLLCGKFPDSNDKQQMTNKMWSKDGFSKEYCSLIEACLQENPRERIRLRKIHSHKWFQDKHQTDDQQKVTECPADEDVNRLSEGEIQLPLARVSQSEDKMGSIEEINSCQYEIGKKLGKGAFGFVYEATRLSDGLKVAVKYVNKDENTDYISIPGCAEKLPREVALQILASEGDDVPEIIQLLDWQDFEKYYVLVLERFTPCEDVGVFVRRRGGSIDEELARVILRQVTEAAEVCRRRGVFHRDIKMVNLLINPDTQEVKLIDFGCGDLLKASTYRTYMGTRKYVCPEYFEKGEYNANPATVYSLGVLLFAMVCGVYPTHNDLYQINEKVWEEDGLTTECCSLIQSCLQENPEERLLLENVHEHVWFQVMPNTSSSSLDPNF